MSSFYDKIRKQTRQIDRQAERYKNAKREIKHAASLGRSKVYLWWDDNLARKLSLKGFEINHVSCQMVVSWDSDSD